MITVKQDSELITNYVAANPIPAGERFVVVSDEHQEPAVFALSEDSILYLIKVIDGQTAKLNFGKTSGVVGDGVAVQAFAVTQAADSSLNICIATRGFNKNESSFHLLHNITLPELQAEIPASKIISGHKFPRVYHIFMDQKFSGDGPSLPIVMVAFKRPDRLADTQDLRFVEFENNSANLLGSWDLATNPSKILDVCMGTCALGDGAFVLYQSFEGQMHLQFKFFRGSTMVVEPHCPPEATCIGSYIDPKSKQSILLIGGPRVVAFKPKEYLSPKGTGEVIDAGDNLTSLRDLQVSQVGEILRLWYTTTDDAVHYYTARTTSLSQGVQGSLLPKGQGGRISSLIQLRSTSQAGKGVLVSSLVSVDQHGNLTLLQQDSASRVWQRFPLWHADAGNIIELKGYMLRMQAVSSTDNQNALSDDETLLIPGCWLRVSCSGVVRCKVNGREVTLSPTAQWLQTNARGILNIIMQSDDMACHQFVADAFRAAKQDSREVLLGNSDILDPSKKVAKKLDHVKDPSDLRALRKPDGSPLIDPSASHDDVKAATDSIRTLVDQVHSFHEKSDKSFAAHRMTVLSNLEAGSPLQTIELYSFGDFIGDIVDGLKDGWHWIEQGLEDAWKWGCEFVGDAAGRVWEFVIHIGEKVYRLALETVSAIVKAITWVFKKIGALIDDIIAFFGFLFQWKDILHTSDSLLTGFNAALDHGQDFVSSGNFKIESWLEDLRSTIKTQLPTLHKYRYNDSKALYQSLSEYPLAGQSAEEDGEEEVKSGVAYNWSTYYFMYGGGTTNARLDDEDEVSGLSASDKTLFDLWDAIQGELGSATKMGAQVVKEILKFFASGEYNLHGVMQMISEELVDNMIDSLKGLSKILSTAMELGIGISKSVANKTIDLPVLGWLWKTLIAPGRSLTLLRLCSLLVAIPMTVMYKTMKKTPPPRLEDRLDRESFGEYVSGKSSGALTDDVHNFRLAASATLEVVYGEFQILALLIDGAFEGLGLELIPIGPIVSVLNVMASSMLVFDGLDAFHEWPLAGKEGQLLATNSLDLEEFAEYSEWALKVIKKAANAVVKKVGKKKGANQMVVKRWKGTVTAVVAVPMLCVAVIKNILEATEGNEKTGLIINHFIMSYLEFGKQWGKAAASWANEVEDPVMYAGLALQQVCMSGLQGLKTVEFLEKYR